MDSGPTPPPPARVEGDDADEADDDVHHAVDAVEVGVAVVMAVVAEAGVDASPPPPPSPPPPSPPPPPLAPVVVVVIAPPPVDGMGVGVVSGKSRRQRALARAGSSSSLYICHVIDRYMVGYGNGVVEVGGRKKDAATITATNHHKVALTHARMHARTHAR